jgi:hypothetical protein
MLRDELVVGGLLVAFALLVTMHLALVFGLAVRPPRWRALVALVVPPLAPWWGYADKMRVRTFAWIGCAVAYAALRWAASW